MMYKCNPSVTSTMVNRDFNIVDALGPMLRMLDVKIDLCVVGRLVRHFFVFGPFFELPVLN